MLDHLAINVSDLARSQAFYEQALAPLGYRVRGVHDQAVAFGRITPSPGDDPGGFFWICQGVPQPLCVHLAFRAPDRSAVHAFHAAALAAGGKDNGAPGPRAHYHAHYYAAFVHDPDGYNIEAVTHLPPPDAVA